MTTYTIQELERLAAEQGKGLDTSRNRSGIDAFRPPPSRRDVRRGIYRAVYEAGKPISRAEIAKALGVRKTPWICQHIERLVDEDYLVRLVGGAPNDITQMYLYRVGASTQSEPTLQA